MKIEIPESVSVTIHGLISRGVRSVSISDTGHLIFTLTDGSEHDLGKVVGETGPKVSPTTFPRSCSRSCRSAGCDRREGRPRRKGRQRG